MQPQNRSSCQKKIDEEEKLIYTIYIPGQKKVEVARGVIELGQILIETKEKLPHGSWIKWLEDSRVGFSVQMANKYVRIARELGQIETSGFNLDVISLNKLYTLASAPEEVKEELGTTNSQVFDSVSINKLYTLASAPEEVKEEYQ